jgi:hypothetical protein
MQNSCRLCENSLFGRKRPHSERIFAIGWLLIAQNGPKLRENWIARLGIPVFTQSAELCTRRRLLWRQKNLLPAGMRAAARSKVFWAHFCGFAYSIVFLIFSCFVLQ